MLLIHSCGDKESDIHFTVYGENSPKQFNHPVFVLHFRYCKNTCQHQAKYMDQGHVKRR